MNMWSVLPDELWRRIMEIGIETESLDYKAICCLSATCRRLRRLADDDLIWLHLLLLSDFAYPGTDFNLSNFDTVKFKTIYKIRYEKERVLAECVREFQERQLRYTQEVQRISERMAEMRNAAMAGNEGVLFWA
ncbi:hypothetical protein BUALT_Bualt12G0052900 [Buddleja alternifolia]|uniref:F-box domain-containing protein n=1 Tax=Buddleja alternifolia TaxID=168488 RepID=A0AAV6WZA2_9LAMI|nr:hypothetical protein BUALT_Bualt12G0052900 [Buddleja alternifolia]